MGACGKKGISTIGDQIPPANAPKFAVTDFPLAKIGKHSILKKKSMDVAAIRYRSAERMIEWIAAAMRFYRPAPATRKVLISYEIRTFSACR